MSDIYMYGAALAELVCLARRIVSDYQTRRGLERRLEQMANHRKYVRSRELVRRERRKQSPYSY